MKTSRFGRSATNIAKAGLAVSALVKRRKLLTQEPAIRSDQFVFVCGLHRSGTSLLHRLLRSSPDVSGMTNTGVPEDEGQHLQSVFSRALDHGGPGRFSFDPAARMDEASSQDVAVERTTLLREWGAYFDLSAKYFVEKSPPNILRSRYLQKLFPGALFIFLVRHPAPVSLATQKWSRTTLLELMTHWHVAHTLMLSDLPHVKNGIVIRYEDLVERPAAVIGGLESRLTARNLRIEEDIIDHNPRYFSKWHEQGKLDECLRDIMRSGAAPMAKFAYTLDAPYYQAMPELMIVRENS